MSALVAIAGVIGALTIHRCVRGTPLRLLFERPQALWLACKQPLALQPPE